MNLKLGKLAPQPHKNTILLEPLLSPNLPALMPKIAEKVYYEYKFPDYAKSMFGNDVYGDCFWAMMANAFISDSAHTGALWVPTLDQVLEAYASTGFDPKTGANDNGTVMTQGLEYMRTVGMGGRKILGWLRVNHTNRMHRSYAVQVFGKTLTGVQLPNSAMLQFTQGLDWEVWQHNEGIAGGHAIIHLGQGSQGDDYGTWAKMDQKANKHWSSHYIDEEYTCVDELWFDTTGKTVEGLDVNQLWQLVKAKAVS